MSGKNELSNDKSSVVLKSEGLIASRIERIGID